MSKVTQKHFRQPYRPSKVPLRPARSFSSLRSVCLCPIISLPEYISGHHDTVCPPDTSSCICQDWDKKNFIFFCTYSIKSLLIFKVQNSLLLLTFSLLPIEEASSFFTTGFLYYSFCLLHCISDKVLTLKHNLYIFVVVNEHLINYVGKYISVILFQHTILG